MEETESEQTLSELVVKELVGQGLESSMRDPILEAVEESEGGDSEGGSRNLPIAGALVGVGAAIGYLAGRESTDVGDVSLEDVEEPEIIEDVTGGDEDETESEAELEAEDAEAEAVEAETETDEEPADGSSSGWLGRLVLAAGLLIGLAVLRRRLGGGDEEEWEPIEEFEPATEIDADDEDEEDDGLEAEAGDADEE
ncbi:hypothetical protein [Natronococcus occultus]|uniref:MYXO-CTERM domain-containing protein n=1 Tax=Natronococcus occultus SP4 TaxID=694430 RepID=L0K3C8_9EURY|nr:hypothetical protein [Natronococcus occultus]AGB39521.1 hypothetical protein Natoc_3815 [Natronococcus occultus SP4]